MKSILLYISLILFSVPAFSQCVESIDIKSPSYIMERPTATFVDEVDEISNNEVKFLQVEENYLLLMDEYKNQVKLYNWEFLSDVSSDQNEDIISAFKITNSKTFTTAKVIYRKEGSCYATTVELYNKKGTLILKFHSDKLRKSYE
ncbi:hypothetical protein [Flammeovirga sp. SubArs3]|uniref:hypothetical protein n=1 Tax=Flammeovirga sp. SubArs3 TaxID=2995316 RepID=UPI00248AE8FD|nr:hypothetical protein [Flammeovirga sp. SubArs3]